MREEGYFYLAFFGFLIIALASLGIRFYDDKPNDDKPQKADIKAYHVFKKDTEVINGTVQKAEKENHFILPSNYNLVVKSKDDSKLISVDEKQYRNYQVGSKVRFRIAKTDDNSIVRDLKKKDDIDSVKKYMAYRDNKGFIKRKIEEFSRH